MVLALHETFASSRLLVGLLVFNVEGLLDLIFNVLRVSIKENHLFDAY